jgi:hypothetical protein
MEDAIFPFCFYDKNGNTLNGANKYVLHFEKGKTPPGKAFWSITLYDSDGYFINNSINRYALGDRSYLKTNADGSLDIYVQKENPANDKLSNWLPAPDGDFNFTLRVYWPKEEMLNGTWTTPGIVKVN